MTQSEADLLKDKMETFRLATGKANIDYMNQAGFNALLESKKAFFLRINNGANLTPGQAVKYKLLKQDCMTLSNWINSTRTWAREEQKAAERLVEDITSDELSKLVIQLEQQANNSKPVSRAKSGGILKTTKQYLTYPIRLLWQLVVLLAFYNKSSTVQLTTANEMLRSINSNNPASQTASRQNSSSTKTAKGKGKAQDYARPHNPFHAASSDNFTGLATVFKTEKQRLIDANEQAIRTINSSNEGPEHVKKRDKGQSTPDLDVGYKLLLKLKKPTTKVSYPSVGNPGEIKRRPVSLEPVPTSVPRVPSKMHSTQYQHSDPEQQARHLDLKDKRQSVEIKKAPMRVDNSSSEGLDPATRSRDPEILLNTHNNRTESDRSPSRERVAGHRDLKGQQPRSFLQKAYRRFSNKTSADTITLSSTPTPERVVAEQSTNNGTLPLSSVVKSSIQAPEIQDLNDQPVTPITHSMAETKIPTYPTTIKDSALHQKLNEYLKANPHPDGWTAEVYSVNDTNLIIIKHSDKDHNLLPQHDIEVHDKTVTARVSLEASEDDINYMANTMFNAYVLSGGDANALNLDTIKHPRMKEALVHIRAKCLADEQAEEHRVQP